MMGEQGNRGTKRFLGCDAGMTAHDFLLAQQESCDIERLAKTACVDRHMVRRCWMCGQRTASPIPSKDPECPHFTCSLECYHDAITESNRAKKRRMTLFAGRLIHMKIDSHENFNRPFSLSLLSNLLHLT